MEIFTFFLKYQGEIMLLIFGNVTKPQKVFSFHVKHKRNHTLQKEFGELPSKVRSWS